MRCPSLATARSSCHDTHSIAARISPLLLFDCGRHRRHGARPARLPAIEPIERHGGPKFKFSLAAYSYRDLLTGKTPQLTLDDFIDDCAKMQLEGTELTSYYFPDRRRRPIICGTSRI